MADNITPQWTDNQITLGQEFNAVAKKFVALITQQSKKRDLIKGISLDQTNSYLATQAIKELKSVPEGEDTRFYAYLNAIKGAALDFSREALEVNGDRKLKRALKGCEESINRALFVEALENHDFPVVVFNNTNPEFFVPSLTPPDP